MHKIFQDIVSNKEIEYLSKTFDHSEKYFTWGMLKAKLPLENKEFINLIHDIIKNRLNIKEDYTILGDNFYKHKHSYFPHCDAVENNAWLNILIPIKLFFEFKQQKFIVFDQLWTGNNATWTGSFDMKSDFLSNKKIIDRPCNSDNLLNQTNKDIPEDLWNEINQKYFTKDYFFSMSGFSYDWKPTSVIVFDSRHIHATGKMNCVEKLGLSIRIGNIND